MLAPLPYAQGATIEPLSHPNPRACAWRGSRGLCGLFVGGLDWDRGFDISRLVAREVKKAPPKRG